MKRFRKYMYGLIGMFLCLSMSCTLEEPLLNEGIIIEQDFTRCMCCGGYFVNIGTFSLEKDSIHTYRVWNLPDDFSQKIDPDQDLPIKVGLNWKLIEGGCQVMRVIEVSHMEAL